MDFLGTLIEVEGAPRATKTQSRRGTLTPSQANDHDCGPFVLMAIKSLCFGQDPASFQGDLELPTPPEIIRQSIGNDLFRHGRLQKNFRARPNKNAQ